MLPKSSSLAGVDEFLYNVTSGAPVAPESVDCNKKLSWNAVVVAVTVLAVSYTHLTLPTKRIV